MESDWLSGKATRELFRRANAETFLEPLMNLQWTPIFYAWSGMLFDLLIPFAVLWKKTRIPAFTAAILFHVNNFIVFPIGVFPLLSLALTAIYFNPDFPKKLIPNWLKNNMYQLYRVPNQGIMHKDDNNMWPHNWLIGFLVLFIFFQLILPFRHHLYPGETKWHQVGHYFAWRMMLRQKLVEIRYNVIHPSTGEKRYAPLDDYLNPSQIRSFVGNPNMNLQFAHYLKKLVIRHGGFVPEITADIYVSLNGRDKQKLVNENLDLGKVVLFTPSYMWIEKFKP